MTINVKQMMEAANAAVPRITAQAQQMIASGNALVVDVRDGTEVQQSGRWQAPYTCRAACSSFAPTPSRLPTTRHSPGTRRILYWVGGRAALSGRR